MSFILWSTISLYFLPSNFKTFLLLYRKRRKIAHVFGAPKSFSLSILQIGCSWRVALIFLTLCDWKSFDLTSFLVRITVSVWDVPAMAKDRDLYLQRRVSGIAIFFCRALNRQRRTSPHKPWDSAVWYHFAWCSTTSFWTRAYPAIVHWYLSSRPFPCICNGKASYHRFIAAYKKIYVFYDVCIKFFIAFRSQLYNSLRCDALR